MSAEDSTATRHRFLSGIAAGLLLVTLVTGVYGRFWFSTDPVDQWVFFAHVLAGALFLVPFLAYLVLHLALVFRTPSLVSERALHAGGILVTISLAWTVMTGVLLAIAPPVRSMMAVVHQAMGYLAPGMLVLHVAHAARRRRESGRGSLGARDRVTFAVVFCGMVSCLVWIASLVAPAPSMEREIPETYTFVKNREGTRAPFFPGLAKTSHRKLIPAGNLAGSARCGECHRDIYRQWRSSSHSFAASNDHYLAQTRLRIHDVPIKPHLGARFCANCHEPIALFAGELDPQGAGVDLPENREEGLSCLSCHRIESIDEAGGGNGGHVIAPHRPSLFEKDEAPARAALGRMLIQARPEAHRQDLMRDLYRRSEFCSSCHQFFFDETINGMGRFQVQDTFEEWKRSPQAATKRCQDCHMPLVDSDDPAAKEYDENGRKVRKVRDHRFLGANTARPFLDKDEEMLAATEDFLRADVVRVELRIPASVEPGSTTSVAVVVTNVGAGHMFPTGTTDMHDAWIEVVARAGSRVVLTSGELGPDGRLDASAHQFRSVALDAEGRPLVRRDLWNIDRYAGTNLIPPGGARTATYLLALPPDVTGEVVVEARVKYRKSNQDFTDFTFDRGSLPDGSGYRGPHTRGVRLPVTTLAEARAVTAVGPRLPAGTRNEDP